MKWFKHYSNASDSQKLNQLIDELGLEGLARYWLLLEILAEEFNGESSEILVHKRQLSQKVHIKFSKKLHNFLDKISELFLVKSWELSDNFYIFDAPILLELKAKDFKRARSERGKVAPKIKRYKDKKNKDKKLKEKSGGEVPALITFQQIQDLWNSSPTFSNVVKLSEKRKTAIRARLKDYPDLENWAEAIKRLEASDFCTGQNNRGWVANFDFLLKPDTITKALEGFYDNREARNSTSELMDYAAEIFEKNGGTND